MFKSPGRRTTGARVAEAVIVPTMSNPLDPGFAGPIVVYLSASGITFRGFTVDEVEVSVSRVGRTSAAFEYTIRRAADSTLCARATLVQVAMSLDARRAVPVPEPLRAAFAQSGE